jgi:hypothetical protein
VGLHKAHQCLFLAQERSTPGTSWLAPEAIERLWSERIAEQAERLAHHALRGEMWEKAVTYLR